MSEYTFEDWLEDRQYFEPTAHIPDTIGIGSVTQEYFNIYVRNSISWLYSEEGVITDSEYQRIKDARSEVFKIAIEHFLEEIPDFVSELLENSGDGDLALTNRLELIDEYFSNYDDKKLLSKVFAKRYPEANISGPVYKDIKENNSITSHIYCAYVSGRADIFPTVLPQILTKKPHPFLLVSILLEEKKLIQQEIQRRELTTDKILDRYEDLKLQIGEENAFEKVEKWLTRELGYTKEEAESKFKFTLTFDAMKKRIQRRS